MQQVSKISVVNKGGYSFNFSVRWLTSDGEWKTTEWNSGSYPVAQSRTSPPLGTIGVADDALAVTVYGHAVWGTSGQGHPEVKYDPGSEAVATYNAVGTTHIGFDIVLVE